MDAGYGRTTYSSDGDEDRSLFYHGKNNMELFYIKLSDPKYQVYIDIERKFMMDLLRLMIWCLLFTAIAVTIAVYCDGSYYHLRSIFNGPHKGRWSLIALSVLWVIIFLALAPCCMFANKKTFIAEIFLMAFMINLTYLIAAYICTRAKESRLTDYVLPLYCVVIYTAGVWHWIKKDELIEAYTVTAL